MLKLKAGGKAVLIFGGVGLAMWAAVHFGLTDRYLSAKPTVAAAVPEMAKSSFSGGSSSSNAAAANTRVEPAGGDYTARVLTIPWNAMASLSYANGGAKTTSDSLMAKGGVHLVIERQDDYSQMQTELAKFSAAVAKGDSKPKEGAAFAIIMGDGYPPFVAGAQQALAKVAPGQELAVVGSTGYSRGEDKCIIDQNADPRGSLIAGVLGDGDINICIQYAADNGIPVNPDQKTYDPRAMNLVQTASFAEADTKFIAGASESRKNVVTGKTESVKVNGSGTWTPGDVNVARKRGNYRVLASSKEYRWQIPAVIIGNKQWMSQNKAFVKNMLAAAFKGAEAINADDKALLKAGAVNAEIFKEESAEYWAKYFKGTVENGIPLGGSAVNTLADNVFLFGLGNNDNLYKRVYTVFGNVNVKYFPDSLNAVVPYEKVVDTTYVKELADATDMSSLAAAKPTYSADAPVRGTFAKKAVSIEFETGKATFTPKASAQLDEVLNNLSMSGMSVQINGHTDNVGSPEANLVLSKKRADAVKAWIVANANSNFPEARVRTRGFGDAQPVADNKTAAGKAQNRRVEIVLLQD